MQAAPDNEGKNGAITDVKAARSKERDKNSRRRIAAALARRCDRVSGVLHRDGPAVAQIR